jgi:two-component system sensor histidine kinase KdpD
MSRLVEPFGFYTGYLVAVLGVAFITLVLSASGGHINPTTTALIYLVFVVVVATFFESRAALAASLLAAFSFNYFFLPPYHTLNIAEPQNWVALAVFLTVAITVGQLSAAANRRRTEAERLYAELEAAFEKASETEALERSEKLKSALLDAVTHDLRTPLTSIKASVTMLIEEELREPAESTLDRAGRSELLEVINEETDRLNTLVESMVKLARIEAGDQKWRRSQVSAQEIIVTAARGAKSIRSTHKVKSDVEPGLPMLSIDSRATVEAVVNLLDNAAKYSPPGTTIYIGAQKTDGGVRFYVEDEGPGIPQSKRETIFERFHRSNGYAGGLGVGLAIVRGIVEGQGGRIWVESSKKGARFVFDLPVNSDGRQKEDTGRR